MTELKIYRITHTELPSNRTARDRFKLLMVCGHVADVHHVRQDQDRAWDELPMPPVPDFNYVLVCSRCNHVVTHPYSATATLQYREWATALLDLPSHHNVISHFNFP